MKVTMMLADHAQVAGGKLYISGGGWSVTGPGPTPGAIAADVKVPWDRRHETHEFLFELVDSDGNAVLGPTPTGVEPITMTAELNPEGTFDGIKPGTPLDAPFTVNYGPLPLAPGGRYEWRLTVNGETEDGWRLPFSTRALAA